MDLVAYEEFLGIRWSEDYLREREVDLVTVGEANPGVVALENRPKGWSYRNSIVQCGPPGRTNGEQEQEPEIGAAFVAELLRRDLDVEDLVARRDALEEDGEAGGKERDDAREGEGREPDLGERGRVERGHGRGVSRRLRERIGRDPVAGAPYRSDLRPLPRRAS